MGQPARCRALLWPAARAGRLAGLNANRPLLAGLSNQLDGPAAGRLACLMIRAFGKLDEGGKKQLSDVLQPPLVTEACEPAQQFPAMLRERHLPCWEDGSPER